MDYKSKRKTIVGSVVASSVLVSLICVIVLSNVISSAEPYNPNPKDTATASAGIETSTASVAQGGTSGPSKTPIAVNTNPGYNGETYSNNNDRTISKTTPPPTETLYIPPEKTQLSSDYRVKLKSFDKNTAQFEITLKFNKSGKVKLIAIDSEKNLRDNIDAPYIRNVFDNAETSLLSAPGALDFSNVTANTEQTFAITTGLAKFDLFIILDTDDEIQTDPPFYISSVGGAPSVSGEPEIFHDEEKNQITITVNTTIDTNIVITILKNGIEIPDKTYTTSNGKAVIEINNANLYNSCAVQAQLKHNGVLGGKYVLIPSINV